ncbi:hypothetical protein OHS33_32175 [Streptomyces sp. NBC_00536]|nr:hypothetical protein [Streptomyces sp. NBC_00536]WUC82611.1 hypothetical protein OHS33_32175 [Streptomyces sp. NBC_00536]
MENLLRVLVSGALTGGLIALVGSLSRRNRRRGEGGDTNQR